MAKNLSKSGITANNTILAWHVTQSVDALTGTNAYDITVSGSFATTGSNEFKGTLKINRGSNGRAAIIGNTNSTFNDMASSVDLYVKSGISSSGVVYGNQGSFPSRLNTNLIRGATVSDTQVKVEDDLTIAGHLSASGVNQTVNRNFSGFSKKVFSVINSETQTIRMSGSVYPSNALITLNMGTAEYDLTFYLPSNMDNNSGYEYDFVVNTTANTGAQLTFFAPTEKLAGMIICSGSENINIPEDTTSFTYNPRAAIKGTKLNFISDGNYWNVLATCLTGSNQLDMG